LYIFYSDNNTGLSESEFLSLIKANQGIIYKLTGLYAADAEEKKDLCQEIICQAWKGWPSFRKDAKFSTWLYRISLNTILTQKRRKKIIEYREDLDSITSSVEQGTIEQENSRRLQMAIRELVETDRALISLHLDGYENGEIAEIVGISANNVGVKLHRIKNQLTKILND
jgi:RNA polymerase sigma factor (sigma-70 family)